MLETSTSDPITVPTLTGVIILWIHKKIGATGIPFEDRVAYLQEWIGQDQEARRDTRNVFGYYGQPAYRIRRTHIVEDGYSVV